MNTQIRFKSTSIASLKDVDVKGRTVTGYYSAFNSIDSDGDVIVPGAYTKTITENGPQGSNRIQHLWQHDPNMPMGKPHLLKEDSHGLYFETKFANTTWANNALNLYDAGVINEHSVGFQTVKSTSRMDYNEISEIKLWEGSTVTFGANPNTPFTGMKAQYTKDQLFEKMDRLLKGIKAGTFTDENAYLLDLSFNELKSMWSMAMTPSSVDTITLNAVPTPGVILDPLKNTSPAASALDPEAVKELINGLKLTLQSN